MKVVGAAIHFVHGLIEQGDGAPWAALPIETQARLEWLVQTVTDLEELS
jgi:hypothetical protein